MINKCDRILENWYSWTFVINRYRNKLVKYRSLAKQLCNNFLAL